MNTNKRVPSGALVNAAWVAEVYQNGWGVPQDYGKALKWYEEAAAAGNTDAMINLGRLYEQGLGVAQDYGKALEWFQKALEAGNTHAMINLTRLREQDLGI
jgi:TPR repeat protein